MRTSGPSTFSPDGSVTVTVTRLSDDAAPGGRRDRRARLPRRRSASGSAASSLRAALVPMPCRSPVGRVAAAALGREVGFCPALASPTSAFGGGVSLSGGAPWPLAVATTLWMYSATALTSSSEMRQWRHAPLRAGAADDRQNQFPA